MIVVKKKMKMQKDIKNEKIKNKKICNENEKDIIGRKKKRK